MLVVNPFPIVFPTFPLSRSRPCSMLLQPCEHAVGNVAFRNDLLWQYLPRSTLARKPLGLVRILQACLASSAWLNIWISRMPSPPCFRFRYFIPGYPTHLPFSICCIPPESGKNWLDSFTQASRKLKAWHWIGWYCSQYWFQHSQFARSWQLSRRPAWRLLPDTVNNLCKEIDLIQFCKFLYNIDIVIFWFW